MTNTHAVPTPFATIGKMLLLVGGLLALTGAMLLAADRFGWKGLPGDFSWRGKNWSVHFPLATSIVVSIVATLILNLLLRGKR